MINYPKISHIIQKNEDIKLFNYLLKTECKKNNIKYFDLTNECTYQKNGIIHVKNEFIGQDHHYKGGEMKPVYNSKIRKDKCYGYSTYFIFLKN